MKTENTLLVSLPPIQVPQEIDPNDVAVRATLIANFTFSLVGFLAAGVMYTAEETFPYQKSVAVILGLTSLVSLFFSIHSHRNTVNEIPDNSTVYSSQIVIL